MSHKIDKTTYNTEGSFGMTDQRTLYADYNGCSDYVTFYDDRGNVILVVEDTMDNNILDAINRLYCNHADNEITTSEELNSIIAKVSDEQIYLDNKERIYNLFKKFVEDEVHGGDFDQLNSLKDTMSVLNRWWKKNVHKI